MGEVTNVGRQLRDEVARDLLGARKARDDRRVAVLRSVLSAIDNAEAVPAAQAYDPSLPRLGATEAARQALGRDAVARLLGAEVRDRREAAEVYRRNGRDDEAAVLDAESVVIEGYLDRLTGPATP